MFDEKTKERREHNIEVLMRLKDMMMESDTWEGFKPYIGPIVAGAMALQRLNEIDFGKEDE